MDMLTIVALIAVVIVVLGAGYWVIKPEHK